MILYIFATTVEASSFGANFCKDIIPRGFNPTCSLLMETNKGNYLVVTGMGPLPAWENTIKAIENLNPALIINCGICGALSDDLSCGDIVLVEKTIDGDLLYKEKVLNECPIELSESQTDYGFSTLPKVTAAMVEKPLFGGPLRDVLKNSADIVDMESHSISRACEKLKKPLIMIKLISDFADTNGKTEIHSNLKSLSRKLCDILSTVENNLHEAKT